jgi:hypothetical protein
MPGKPYLFKSPYKDSLSNLYAGITSTPQSPRCETLQKIPFYSILAGGDVGEASGFGRDFRKIHLNHF